MRSARSFTPILSMSNLAHFLLPGLETLWEDYVRSELALPPPIKREDVLRTLVEQVKRSQAKEQQGKGGRERCLASSQAGMRNGMIPENKLR